MSETQTRTQRTDGTTALFDRYTLPKVALTVILAASLVGTWVTTDLNGGNTGLAAAKWAYFVASGILAGGLLWQHVFVRPADLGSDAAEYCAEMYTRFDRIAAGAVVIAVLGGTIVVRTYLQTWGAVPGYGFGVLLAAWLAVIVATTVRSGGVDRGFRSALGLTGLGLAAVVLVATAVAEVALRGFDPLAAGVRTLHLLAFAAWIGGAVWNIFVAVPTGEDRPTVPVVRAAGQQLERFRWAVRFIIPTILLTGLYQAVDGLGTSLGTYLSSGVGIAILAKGGAIVLLVVIFKLCPMWRACSPIEGVCELEDFGGTDRSENQEVTKGE